MEDRAETDNGLVLPEKWFPAEVETAAAPDAGRRAVVYSRYSYLGKRESSIERQEDICIAYIEANNYVLVRTYADRARTGTSKAGREELKSMQEDAAKKMFDIVVVEDIDRLGRALEVTVEIWNELKELGIELHDSELGKLSPGQIGAKAGASDEERRRIVKRNREGKRRKVRSGGWSGNVCFGYRRRMIDEKSAKTIIEIHPEEAAIVKEIFELYARGVSCDRIAEILNRRPAEERGNRFWSGHEIRGSRKYGSGFLRRLRYAGVSVHGRNSRKKKGNKYEVKPNLRKTWAVGKLDKKLIIIEQDLFERVQERLNRESRGPSEPTWTVRHYPLGGLLYCASCGGKMTPSLTRNHGTPRAKCNRARTSKSIKPGGERCDNQRSAPIDQIDDMVREVVCSEVVHPAAFQAFVDEYNSHRIALAEKDNEKRPNLQRALLELEAERSDLWKSRHTFGDDFVNTRATDITARIASTKEKLDRINAAPRDDIAFDQDVVKVLAADIDAVFAPGFDAMTATGASVVAKLRTLVAKVVVELTDDDTSIELHCNVAAVVENCGSGEVIKFRRSRPRAERSTRHAQAELRRIDAVAKAGTHALRDREWTVIGPLIPESIARSKRGSAAVDPRKVVDAALLHLNEGVPLTRMPATFGDAVSVFAALKRLSSSGAWEVVTDVLRKIAPNRLPTKSSDMFCTVKGRYSTSLKGLPEIRARHGVEMDAGKHAPTDEEWSLVKDLVPEQALMVHKERPRITPRAFLHGILYMLKTGTPVSNMPLQIGSERYFVSSISRLVNHGYWDRLVKRLAQESPTTLASADLYRLDTYPRSSRERTVFRRAIAKSADMTGIPSHFPSEREWGLIKHLFPPELLYVDDKLAVDNPHLLAHAILYRVKEKIPYTAFPPYFGDPWLLGLTITKFVFHHLWEEMVDILQANSPATLKDADMGVFSKYKRGKTRRYAHLLPAVEHEVPPHAPTDAQWALVEHLLAQDILVVRGKPAIMEPRKFLHAIMYMVMERVKFGGLPKAYFGSIDDVRFAMRKLVRHHYWDTMAELFKHFDEEWAAKADLTLFDKLDRSKNDHPAFRKHRLRRSRAGSLLSANGREGALDGMAARLSSSDAN
jgi:site-specific DNA recombinase